MRTRYHTPDLTKRAFARTNRQTLTQRAAILRQLIPNARRIADICCGDCSRQRKIYFQELDILDYRGLDIHPDIVRSNQAQGIDCVCGDALDVTVVSQFQEFDVVFFGPPLSADCDGHTALGFEQVVPGYGEFLRLFFGRLNYNGTIVCICPKSTTMGDARRLYEQVRELRDDVGLRLIHYSISTLTGSGKPTGPRLKYVELWLSSALDDLWEVRRSGVGEESSS